MTSVIEAASLTKRYGGHVAVDSATFAIEADSITGLLGGNGAGKTTLMSLITGQAFLTSGTVRVFGERPLENERVLSRTCFVRESLRYPNNFKVRHVLEAGRHFYPQWDIDLAHQLVDAFELPRSRQIQKFSRGMTSAVGIVIGLASRAPLTIFDEPYLGLDALARQRFYDHLLADYAVHPRTIILSSHLVDEIAKLLDSVLLIDRGHLVLDSPAEDLRGRAVTLTGRLAAVEELARPYTVLRRESMGSLATITVYGDLDVDLGSLAAQLSVEAMPASLQQLVVNAGALRAAATSAPASVHNAELRAAR
ncbi:MAG: ABC transporter ATP-binding protein [Jatrophihabitantaceae bacterium]